MVKGRVFAVVIGLLIALTLGLELYSVYNSRVLRNNIINLDKGLTACEGLNAQDTIHFGGQANKFYPCLLKEVKAKRSGMTWQEKMNVISKHEKSHKILGFCHDLMHVIGEEYYSYINPNLKIPSLCGDGLFHGIIQTAAKKGDDKRLEEAVAANCKAKDGSYDGLCIHGIGHVYWEQLLNLDFFISKCYASVPGLGAEREANILICEDGFLMKGSTLIKDFLKIPKKGVLVGDNSIKGDREKAKMLLSKCDEYKGNLSYGCKVVFWRWYISYYLITHNTVDFTFADKSCNSIVNDNKARDFCAREIGVMVLDYMKYNQDYGVKNLYLFCTKNTMNGCIDGVFEQYSENPQLYDENNNKNMLNFSDYTSSICSELGKDVNYGDVYFKDCNFIRDRRIQLRISG